MKQENEGDNKRLNRRLSFPIPIILATIGTLAWIGLALGHIFYNKNGLNSINCLTLNEFGDFLAGLFAPLAFLWLVVAVFVQKDELRAQLIEFQRFYALQASNVEFQSAESKFKLVAEIANDLAKALELDRTNFSGFLMNDQYDEAIKEFSKTLKGFLTQLESRNRNSQSILRNNDSISYYVGKLQSEISFIVQWARANKNDDILSRILSANILDMRNGLTTLELFLPAKVK